MIFLKISGDSTEKTVIFINFGGKAMLNELFLRFPDFKLRAVTFSFDDGHFEDRRMVEGFDKWGIKCTFNLDLRYMIEKENTYIILLIQMFMSGQTRKTYYLKRVV